MATQAAVVVDANNEVWMSCYRNFNLQLVLPLDEFSERVHHGDYTCTEFQALRQDLVMGAKVDPDLADVLRVVAIEDVSMERIGWISTERVGDFIKVTLPVKIVYEAKRNFPPDELLDALEPYQSLPTLYGELPTDVPGEDEDDE